MQTPDSAPLTVLLHAWQRGDREAFCSLIKHAQVQLRRMADARLRAVDTSSWAAGDLINEALLKLIEAPPRWQLQSQTRAHFFATISLAMRSVLVDHVRSRSADKRGGDWQRLTWTASGHGEDSMTSDLLTLDALLDQLEKIDPRAAGILQMTYFGGLDRSEIAALLDLSLATIDRELRFSRAWLATRLGRGLEA